MWVGGQHHTLTALLLGKRPGTHHTGGCVGPRAGLLVFGKSCPIVIRPQSIQPIASRYTDSAIPANLEPQAFFLIHQGLCDSRIVILL